MEVGGWLQGPTAGRRHPASVLGPRRAPRPGGGAAVATASFVHRPGTWQLQSPAFTLVWFCGKLCFPKMTLPSPRHTHTHTHMRAHTHTHTPFVLTLLTLCTRWGLGRDLCPPSAAECDGLRAVTGQARTGRDGASRDSSRLGSPSWEPLGCLEALSTWKSRVQASQSWAPPGGHASGSKPYGGSSRPPRRADPSPPRSQAVSRTGRALVLSHHGSG